jgi:hypothetical protein
VVEITASRAASFSHAFEEMLICRDFALVEAPHLLSAFANFARPCDLHYVRSGSSGIFQPPLNRRCTWRDPSRRWAGRTTPPAPPTEEDAMRKAIVVAAAIILMVTGVVLGKSTTQNSAPSSPQAITTLELMRSNAGCCYMGKVGSLRM